MANPEDLDTELEILNDRGYLNGDLANWLRRWLDHLEGLRGCRLSVLIHGDAAPHNLLVDAGGRLHALLDWGDAQYHDPAVDFAKLPLRALPDALDGYLGQKIGDDERLAWVAAVMWYQLSWAVSRLPTGPEPTATHWSAQPANRLWEILRFYTGSIPAGWEALKVSLSRRSTDLGVRESFRAIGFPNHQLIDTSQWHHTCRPPAAPGN